MPMTQGVFIIGTDTGVGKTVIAAGLAVCARSRGIRVGVMKPVATGCLNGDGLLRSHDALFLLKASGNSSYEMANPIGYAKPLAPLAASRLENREVDLTRVRQAYQHLRENFDFLIVEGIGGLRVPITENYFVSDLVKEFDLPVILVSRTKLGTINHTLLTLESAKSHGLDVKGIIFNDFVENSMSLDERTSPDLICELSGVPVLGKVPHIEGLNVESYEYGNLSEVIQEKVDLEKIFHG